MIESEKQPGACVTEIESQRAPAVGEDAAFFAEGESRACVVVAGAAGALFCSFGFANTFGVFQGYYLHYQLSEESPSAISWIGSLQIFFLLAGNILGGPLFDLIGAMIVWPPVVVFVAAVMTTSVCKTFLHFLIVQGLIAGICMGMIMAPAMTAVSQAFSKRRALAIGVAMSGSSLGGIVFPITLSRLLSSPLGFGTSVRICGCIIAAVLIPSAVAIRARLPSRRKKFILLSAFKAPGYIGLIWAVFLLNIGLFIPMIYLPTYALTRGVTNEVAFSLSAVLNGFSVVGRIVPGLLAQWLGPVSMLSTAAFLSGLVALCWPGAVSVPGLAILAAAYGFSSGALVSLIMACFANTASDPKDIGTYSGQGLFITSFGVLIGPPLGGILIASNGTFWPPAIFSGLATISGGFLAGVVAYSGKASARIAS